MNMKAQATRSIQIILEVAWVKWAPTRESNPNTPACEADVLALHYRSHFIADCTLKKKAGGGFATSYA